MKVIPYFCCGHPSIEFSYRLAKALAPYSCALEIGLPFSDPIADGKIIQKASAEALENKANRRAVFGVARKLRKHGIALPLYLMTYFNPVYAAGTSFFLATMKAAGFNGIIIPDLPFCEGKEFRKTAEKSGIEVVGILAPNTDYKTAKRIIDSSHGFVYLVSALGTTGTKKEVPAGSLEFVSSARKIAGEKKKLFVGFGVSNAKQARSLVNAGADGVIVGSRFIEMYSRHFNANSFDERTALEEVVDFMETLSERGVMP